jgi:hypothetical protein
MKNETRASIEDTNFQTATFGQKVVSGHKSQSGLDTKAYWQLVVTWLWLWLFTILSAVLNRAVTALIDFSGSKKKSYPCKRPWKPIGLRNVQAPTFFRRSTHKWRQGCQPYSPVAHYTQNNCWYLFLLDVDSSPVRLERWGQLKKQPTTCSADEPATFTFVAGCLNPLRYRWIKHIISSQVSVSAVFEE